MENVLVANTFELDANKPLVKDFFDKDAAIEKHLLDRLPHLPYFSKVNVVKLYTRKDGVTHKYRVNWFGQTGAIDLSQYVTIKTAKDGSVTEISHSNH